MHKHLRITFLLMISAFLFAGPVDIGEAKHLAKNFFPEKTPDSFRAISDQLFLSTFEGGGFLLISRDDAFPPVLGYSRTAPADSMHPAFEAHCSDYSLQISRYASASCEAHPDWDHYRNARFRKPASQEISPLISSRWNQSPYYNDLFPYLTLPGYTDRQAYAGCVAVVMGQLMRYYRHPVRGFGRRSYFSYSTDSTLSAWFDTTYYDWDNMPDSLSVLSAADEVAEVSRLLYQSAISVEMDLQPDGSSSTYEDMMYALISYFDYATGMTLRNKDSSSDTEWKTMIRSELDDGNPVPYRGQGDAGGHAYLLDGYRVTGDTYFHFNWGWGGQYDGWFLLSALAPAEGYDFTERQAAVLGIRKNTGDTVRLAYSGFEHWLEGWIYSAEKFFLRTAVMTWCTAGISLTALTVPASG
ncbi:MAG: C10 family peptidase [Candidatus Marinimicrobia bacterium]|nr:C10 family peptidase [Candidatus Neomarinimicrobiota bacterium]